MQIKGFSGFANSLALTFKNSERVFFFTYLNERDDITNVFIYETLYIKMHIFIF